MTDRPHTPELVPSSTPGRWRTVCAECSEAAQDYVPVCTGPGWAYQVPGELMAVADEVAHG